MENQRGVVLATAVEMLFFSTIKLAGTLRCCATFSKQRLMRLVRSGTISGSASSATSSSTAISVSSGDSSCVPAASLVPGSSIAYCHSTLKPSQARSTQCTTWPFLRPSPRPAAAVLPSLAAPLLASALPPAA
eukprot:5060-Heterococcus_DN1.PRE.1